MTNDFAQVTDVHVDVCVAGLQPDYEPCLGRDQFHNTFTDFFLNVVVFI